MRQKRRKPKKHGKHRSVDEISATPEARAVREAIRLIGGTAPAGSMVQRKAGTVQKWTEDPNRMEPALARVLAKATGYRVTVAAMRPDVFADLTAQELGYLPKAYAERQA